jgi:hypothetical protein
MVVAPPWIETSPSPGSASSRRAANANACAEARSSHCPGHLRQQAQHREPDQETIRCLSRTQSECHAERIALRTRQPLKPVQQGCAQLVESSEGELHLRLHADSPRNPEPRGRLDRVLQQRCLANAWLPAQHQRAAHPAASGNDQRVQR